MNGDVDEIVTQVKAVINDQVEYENKINHKNIGRGWVIKKQRHFQRHREKRKENSLETNPATTNIFVRG